MILTRHDLSDDQNRRDCIEDFRRARDGHGSMSLSAWAAKWGDAICEELMFPSEDPDASEDLRKLERELDTANAKVAELQDAAEKATTELEKAIS